MYVFDDIIKKLEKAKEAASFHNASFGFPNDRIEIRSVQFGNEESGRTGDVLHPTAYVTNITRNYQRTWVIGPIKEAIDLLRIHAETLKDCERLIVALHNLGIEEIADRARAGMLTKDDVS